ncbi:glycosyltransferase [Nafulsella turpanensis]|uniref:glycosyltransferase n=1 Tax=Nafulsella turpanensis TaxID=1265690 RepID=UPI00037F83F2|nr:glycosyltransferase [Nafulsella turpanensis]
MQKPAVSVIISVYNKLEWLRLVLAALEVQTFKDFEVIIADDGSGDDFKKGLEEYSKRSPLKIKHVWHEDKGFRKTRILNKAVKEAAAAYLLFIDGDCVPDPHFVADHWHNRAINTSLAGRRANLSERLTAQLNPDKIRRGFLSSLAFYRHVWMDSFRKRSKHAEKSLRLPTFLYRLMPKRSKGILGCNFSLHKQDLLEVNGFDMRYEAPGHGEDTDIDLRLKWAGKKVKLLKFQAIQYHLYHRKLERESNNPVIFEQVLKNKEVATRYGLNELE